MCVGKRVYEAVYHAEPRLDDRNETYTVCYLPTTAAPARPARAAAAAAAASA